MIKPFSQLSESQKEIAVQFTLNQLNKFIEEGIIVYPKGKSKVEEHARIAAEQALYRITNGKIAEFIT